MERPAHRAGEILIAPPEDFGISDYYTNFLPPLRRERLVEGRGKASGLRGAIPPGMPL